MIRAVLDANVFVSAVLSPRGAPAKLLGAWRNGRFGLLLSLAILQEIGRVLRYPRLFRRHGWPEARIRTFLADLTRLALLTPGELHLEVLSQDPSDDRYLERAVEGDAAYLVTGDDHLLRLERYRAVKIVRPTEFLRALAWERRPGP